MATALRRLARRNKTIKIPAKVPRRVWLNVDGVPWRAIERGLMTFIMRAGSPNWLLCFASFPTHRQSRARAQVSRFFVCSFILLADRTVYRHVLTASYCLGASLPAVVVAAVPSPESIVFCSLSLIVLAVS
jgi:hypothetical protein